MIADLSSHSIVSMVNGSHFPKVCCLFKVITVYRSRSEDQRSFNYSLFQGILCVNVNKVYKATKQFVVMR